MFQEPDIRRFRSKSDGFQGQPQFMEPFEVFPSLPDSVLEQMGLLGDMPRLVSVNYSLYQIRLICIIRK